MAPPIQPKTLYALAFCHVGALIERACDKIQRKEGTYENPSCVLAVSTLQGFLCSSLHGNIIDDLCEEQRFRDVHSDVRVKLSLFMHPFMRKFSVAQHSYENRQGFGDFWIQRLPSLTHLVVLSLYHVATDEIIEVVSNHCPLLEDVNIVSKVENVKTSDEDDFNAMKLKFFVSDVGLNHLVKCKKLKIITTIKTIRSNCGGRMITLDGLRSLLKALPKLEMVRFGDLGSVIATGMDNVRELALTYVSDGHPSASHIEATARLCPQLKHLSLSLPHQDRPSESGSDAMGEEIARCLAQSDMKPAILELQHFTFNKEIANLFVVKGAHISSLFLCSMNTITSKEIKIIGRNCPNVKNVHIKGLGPEPVSKRAARPRPYPNLRPVSKPEPMFHNLKCLYVSGKSWDIEKILQLFLTYALELTGLNIWNNEATAESDCALSKIISHLLFDELKSANFCYGCRLSVDTVRKFIYQCPKLTHLTVFVHDGLCSSHIVELQKEATATNLDIEKQMQTRNWCINANKSVVAWLERSSS